MNRRSFLVLAGLGTAGAAVGVPGLTPRRLSVQEKQDILMKWLFDDPQRACEVLGCDPFRLPVRQRDCDPVPDWMLMP